MSKRLITMIVSVVLVPLASKMFDLSPDTIWPIVTMILGYLGIETVRPSGTKGLMGSGGAVTTSK